MSEPMSDPMRRQLTSGRRIPTAALLPGAPRASPETSLPGHLCEVCLDAPAVGLQPAPWGGEMGVCTACGGLEPAAPARPWAVVPACPVCVHLPGPELTITHNFRELRERPKGQRVDNKKGAADNKL